MTKYGLIVIALMFGLLLSACGAGRAYQANVGSWIGAPLEELVGRWGPPDQTLKDARGQRQYIWVTSTAPVWIEPQTYNPPVQYSDEDDFEFFKRKHDYDYHFDPGGHYTSIICRSTVKVDDHNRVVKISPESFLGLSNCRFVDPPPARP